jgi:hypothetical protein
LRFIDFEIFDLLILRFDDLAIPQQIIPLQINQSFLNKSTNLSSTNQQIDYEQFIRILRD